MKSSGQALLIVIAMVLGAYGIQMLASETPPTISDNRDDCAADERSDCAERCLTEHNCCIKSCNWVESKAKSKCIKHCKSILEKCYQTCEEKPEADKEDETPPERNPPSESEG